MKLWPFVIYHKALIIPKFQGYGQSGNSAGLFSNFDHVTCPDIINAATIMLKEFIDRFALKSE